MATEHERIRELTRIFAHGTRDGVRIGIGDDAAVLEASAGSSSHGSAADSVLSVDVQVEDVHFRREWLTPEDIGHRALSSALSDLAAMCARPRAALCAWILPPSLADAELYAIAAGTAEAARQYACPIVGGNLARGRELSLTTTVVGEAVGPIPSRANALEGDELFVIGELGMSALGRHALQAGRAELAKQSVARFRRPVARVVGGLAVAGLARAAIDVSDGLLQDLAQLGEASGVGFELSLDALPTCAEHAAGAAALGLDALDALELVLAGGEDYALLFTAAAGSKPSHGVRIGRVVGTKGIVLRDQTGARVEPPTRRGFDHFGT